MKTLRCRLNDLSGMFSKTRKGLIEWCAAFNATKAVAMTIVACFLLSFVTGQSIAALLENHREAQSFNKSVDSFAIPSSLGRISDAKYFGSGQVVINIQDLHCHPEVQRNISKILSFLDGKYGLESVYLEGAFSRLDTSWFSGFSASTKGKLVESLMNDGKLTGAEHYSLVSGKDGLVRGLEDRGLYMDNLKRLGAIMDSREDIDAGLTAIDYPIDNLKREYFNGRQKKMDSLVTRFSEGKMEGRKYYALLKKHAEKQGINTLAYRNFTLYTGMMDQEKQFDYRRISSDLKDFIAVLRQKLPYSAYASLVKETDNFSDVDRLYTILIKLTREYNLSVSGRFGALSAFFEYIQNSRSVNPLTLVREEKALIREIQCRLADNRSQREVAFLDDYRHYLRDFATSRITADDYAWFTENRTRFRELFSKYVDARYLARLDSRLSVLNDYYAVNLQRNEAFIRNFLGAVRNDAPRPALSMVDEATQALETVKTGENLKVVVTGGFHTEGLSKLLADRHISYITITPNVTKDTKSSDELYARVIKAQSKIAAATFAQVALLENGFNNGLTAAEIAAATPGAKTGEDIIEGLNKELERKSSPWRIDSVDADNKTVTLVRAGKDENGQPISTVYEYKDSTQKLEVKGSESTTRNMTSRNRLGAAAASGAIFGAAGAAITLLAGISIFGAAVGLIPLFYFLVERSYINSVEIKVIYYDDLKALFDDKSGYAEAIRNNLGIELDVEGNYRYKGVKVEQMNAEELGESQGRPAACVTNNNEPIIKVNVPMLVSIAEEKVFHGPRWAQLLPGGGKSFQMALPHVILEHEYRHAQLRISTNRKSLINLAATSHPLIEEFFVSLGNPVSALALVTGEQLPGAGSPDARRQPLTLAQRAAIAGAFAAGLLSITVVSAQAATLVDSVVVTNPLVSMAAVAILTVLLMTKEMSGPDADSEIVLDQLSVPLRDLWNRANDLGNKITHLKELEYFHSLFSQTKNTGDSETPRDVNYIPENLVDGTEKRKYVGYAPSALLIPEDRKVIASDTKKAKEERKELEERAKGAIMLCLAMNGGLGTSLIRKRYLRLIWEAIGRLGQAFRLSAKASDLYEDVTISGLNENRDKVEATVKVNVAEKKLLQVIIEQLVHKGFAETIMKELASDESVASINELYESVNIYGRCGLRAPWMREEDEGIDRRTYKQIFAEEDGLTLESPYEQQLQNVVDENNELLPRLSPGGHGFCGFFMLLDSMERAIPPDTDALAVLYNSDGINNGIDPFVAGLIIKDKNPLTIVATPRRPDDYKVGLLGKYRRADGDEFLTMEDPAGAEQLGQLDIFSAIGITIGEPGTQYINTNTVIGNIRYLQPFLRDLREVIGDEELRKAMAPTLMRNKKQDGDQVYFHVEGTLGSVVLNLNKFLETTKNHEVEACMKRHCIGSKNGRPLVRIVNIDEEDRINYFTPVKYAIDFWLQSHSDIFKMNTETWRMETTSPGHIPRFVLEVSNPRDSDVKKYYSDLQNCIDAFGHASTRELDLLEINGNGIVTVKDAVLKGNVKIINNSGKAIDLNTPESRKQLGISGMNRLVLENVQIEIQEGNEITVTLLEENGAVTEEPGQALLMPYADLEILKKAGITLRPAVEFFDRAYKIIFGTSGWRDKRAKPEDVGPGEEPGAFNKNNVSRGGAGLAHYLLEIYGDEIAEKVAAFKRGEGERPVIRLGGDSRWGNVDDIHTVAAILSFTGAEVVVYDEPIPTPVLTWLAQNDPNSICVVNFTASHNPKEDKGMKISDGKGGPLLKADTDLISKYANDESIVMRYRTADYEQLLNAEGWTIRKGDFKAAREGYAKYLVNELKGLRDTWSSPELLDALKNPSNWDVWMEDIANDLQDGVKLKILVDCMQGTSVEFMKEVFFKYVESDVTDRLSKRMREGKLTRKQFDTILSHLRKDNFYEILHTEYDNGEFEEVNGAPNPTLPDHNKPLRDRIKKLSAMGYKVYALATDGDADRFGFFDVIKPYSSEADIENAFVSSNDTVLLTGADRLDEYTVKGQDKFLFVRTSANGMLLDKKIQAARQDAKKHKRHLDIKIVETSVGFKHMVQHIRAAEAEGRTILVAGESSAHVGYNSLSLDDGMLTSLMCACIMSKRKSLIKMKEEIEEEVGVRILNAEYATDPEKKNKDGIRPMEEKLKANLAQAEKDLKVKNPKRKKYDRKEIKKGSVTWKLIADDLAKVPEMRSKKIKSIDIVDGFRVTFADDGNIIIRYSGTEAKGRIYVQMFTESIKGKARDQRSEMKKISDEVYKKAGEALLGVETPAGESETDGDDYDDNVDKTPPASGRGKLPLSGIGIAAGFILAPLFIASKADASTLGESVVGLDPTFAWILIAGLAMWGAYEWIVPILRGINKKSRPADERVASEKLDPKPLILRSLGIVVLAGILADIIIPVCSQAFTSIGEPVLTIADATGGILATLILVGFFAAKWWGFRERTSLSNDEFAEEKRGASILQKLFTDKVVGSEEAAKALGVKAGRDVILGVFGNVSGYFNRNGGYESFMETYNAYTRFFENNNRNLDGERAQSDPKDNFLVIKLGIGGQMTPWLGIVSVMRQFIGRSVFGYYELGLNYKEELDDLVLPEGITWDRVLIIASSKSGSTDETMKIFVKLLMIMARHKAALNNFDGDLFAKALFKTMHDHNLDEHGMEKADLFNMDIIDLVTETYKTMAKESRTVDELKPEVEKVFRDLLRGIMFETSNNPKSSRLAAFVKNSGLAGKLGKDADNFAVIPDNLGGRWTFHLHMISVLAFRGLNPERYWKAVNKAVEKVRAETHPGLDLGDRIVDGGYEVIRVVMNDEEYDLAPYLQQNFNESVWQKGAPTLMYVKASNWEAHKAHCARDARFKTIVLNLSSLSIDQKGFNVVDLPFRHLGRLPEQKRAEQLGLLAVYFNAMTMRVGLRLNERALNEEGFSASDIDLDDISSGRARSAFMVLKNKSLSLQPEVETAKHYVEEVMKGLLNKGRAVIQKYYKKTALKEARETTDKVANGTLDLASELMESYNTALEERRILAVNVYGSGKEYREFRDYVESLGLDILLLQGTKDQHITMQQVLAQPDRFSLFEISFVQDIEKDGTAGEKVTDEDEINEDTYIGFVKTFLHGVFDAFLRDTFADKTCSAFEEKAGAVRGTPRCKFFRLIDDPANYAGLGGSFRKVADGQPAVTKKSAKQGILEYYEQRINGLQSTVLTFFNILVDAERFGDEELITRARTALDQALSNRGKLDAGQTEKRLFLLAEEVLDVGNSINPDLRKRMRRAAIPVFNKYYGKRLIAFAEVNNKIYGAQAVRNILSGDNAHVGRLIEIVFDKSADHKNKMKAVEALRKPWVTAFLKRDAVGHALKLLEQMQQDEEKAETEYLKSDKQKITQMRIELARQHREAIDAIKLSVDELRKYNDQVFRLDGTIREDAVASGVGVAVLLGFAGIVYGCLASGIGIEYTALIALLALMAVVVGYAGYGFAAPYFSKKYYLKILAPWDQGRRKIIPMEQSEALKRLRGSTIFTPYEVGAIVLAFLEKMEREDTELISETVQTLEKNGVEIDGAELTRDGLIKAIKKLPAPGARGGIVSPRLALALGAAVVIFALTRALPLSTDLLILAGTPFVIGVTARGPTIPGRNRLGDGLKAFASGGFHVIYQLEAVSSFSEKEITLNSGNCDILFNALKSLNRTSIEVVVSMFKDIEGKNHFWEALFTIAGKINNIKSRYAIGLTNEIITFGVNAAQGDTDRVFQLAKALMRTGDEKVQKTTIERMGDLLSEKQYKELEAMLTTPPSALNEDASVEMAAGGVLIGATVLMGIMSLAAFNRLLTGEGITFVIAGAGLFLAWLIVRRIQQPDPENKLPVVPPSSPSRDLTGARRLGILLGAFSGAVMLVGQARAAAPGDIASLVLPPSITMILVPVILAVALIASRVMRFSGILPPQTPYETDRATVRGRTLWQVGTAQSLNGSMNVNTRQSLEEAGMHTVAIVGVNEGEPQGRFVHKLNVTMPNGIRHEWRVGVRKENGLAFMTLYDTRRVAGEISNDNRPYKTSETYGLAARELLAEVAGSERLRDVLAEHGVVVSLDREFVVEIMDKNAVPANPRVRRPDSESDELRALARNATVLCDPGLLNDYFSVTFRNHSAKVTGRFGNPEYTDYNEISARVKRPRYQYDVKLQEGAGILGWYAEALRYRNSENFMPGSGIAVSARVNAMSQNSGFGEIPDAPEFALNMQKNYMQYGLALQGLFNDDGVVNVAFTRVNGVEFKGNGGYISENEIIREKVGQVKVEKEKLHNFQNMMAKRGKLAALSDLDEYARAFAQQHGLGNEAETIDAIKELLRQGYEQLEKSFKAIRRQGGRVYLPVTIDKGNCETVVGNIKSWVAMFNIDGIIIDCQAEVLSDEQVRALADAVAMGKNVEGHVFVQNEKLRQQFIKAGFNVNTGIIRNREELGNVANVQFAMVDANVLWGLPESEQWVSKSEEGIFYRFARGLAFKTSEEIRGMLSGIREKIRMGAPEDLSESGYRRGESFPGILNDTAISALISLLPLLENGSFGAVEEIESIAGLMPNPATGQRLVKEAAAIMSREDKNAARKELAGFIRSVVEGQLYSRYVDRTDLEPATYNDKRALRAMILAAVSKDVTIGQLVEWQSDKEERQFNERSENGLVKAASMINRSGATAFDIQREINPIITGIMKDGLKAGILAQKGDEREVGRAIAEIIFMMNGLADHRRRTKVEEFQKMLDDMNAIRALTAAA